MEQHQDLEQAVGAQEGKIQVVVQGDRGLLYQEGSGNGQWWGDKQRLGQGLVKDKYK